MAERGFQPPLDQAEEALLVCMTSLYKAELDLTEAINRLTLVAEAVKLCTESIMTYEINKSRAQLFTQQLGLLQSLRKILHDFTATYLEVFFRKRASRIAAHKFIQQYSN